MDSTGLHFSTACGHEAIVKPVKKIGGKHEGKWICRITGPMVTNQKGVKTTFSKPDQTSSQERIAIALGLTTSEVRLTSHAVTPCLPVKNTAQTRVGESINNAPSSLQETPPKSDEENESPKKRKCADHQKTIHSNTISDAEMIVPVTKSGAKTKNGRIVAVRANLRDSLRTLRLNIATRKKLPVYFIFDNTALDEIVATLPLTEQELLTVRGIRQKKATEHGPEIIAIIRMMLLPMVVSASSAQLDTAGDETCTSRFFRVPN